MATIETAAIFDAADVVTLVDRLTDGLSIDARIRAIDIASNADSAIDDLENARASIARIAKWWRHYDRADTPADREFAILRLGQAIGDAS